jgi:protease secretion system membrane fusion protein
MRMKLEAESGLKSLEAAYYKEIDTQLAQIQSNRDAMKDRFQAIEFDRDLTAIRAPVSGTVVGLKINTVGGTVAGGTVLAEIVPQESSLVVEVKVPPNSVDKVKVGFPADIRFSGLNYDSTPLIPGTVKYVGIDVQPGAAGSSEGDFYLAKIEATKEGLQILSKVEIAPGNSKLGTVEIHPGMPVDVVFKTGERTFMSYLIKPLTDKFALAFK